MWMVAANYRWTHSPSQLAWSDVRLVARWRSFRIHQINWVNSRNGSDNSTISIVVVISIIINRPNQDNQLGLCFFQ